MLRFKGLFPVKRLLSKHPMLSRSASIHLYTHNVSAPCILSQSSIYRRTFASKGNEPLRQSVPLKEPANSNNPSSVRRENIWTLPNVLTMSRLAAAPLIGYFIVHHQHPLALGLTVYACVTDFVDGWIARRFNKQSVVGSILDPAADKALMITLASCLTVSGSVPVWCGGAILGRDALLLFAAIFVRYASLPPPKTFWRYWDLSIPSVQVNPTTISKWNTGFQMLYLGLCVANPVFSLIPLELQDWLAVLVTATTVLSGLSYISSKDAVKIIK